MGSSKTQRKKSSRKAGGKRQRRQLATVDIEDVGLGVANPFKGALERDPTLATIPAIARYLKGTRLRLSNMARSALLKPLPEEVRLVPAVVLTLPTRAEYDQFLGSVGPARTELREALQAAYLLTMSERAQREELDRTLTHKLVAWDRALRMLGTLRTIAGVLGARAPDILGSDLDLLLRSRGIHATRAAQRRAERRKPASEKSVDGASTGEVAKKSAAPKRNTTARKNPPR